MIYVTLGTQKFNFNRLLEYVDRAIIDGVIREDVIVQTGYSDYKPVNYKSIDFIEKHKIDEIILKSRFIISHGGSGNIIEALKKNKKIIAIPRDSDLNEHIDNHQFELVKKLTELNVIMKANNYEELIECINNIDRTEFKPIYDILDNCKIMKQKIDDYIKSNF